MFLLRLQGRPGLRHVAPSAVPCPRRLVRDGERPSWSDGPPYSGQLPVEEGDERLGICLSSARPERRRGGRRVLGRSRPLASPLPGRRGAEEVTALGVAPS